LRDRLSRIAKLHVETVEGAGHHLHLERPETVAARIRNAWGGMLQ
jgi:pimeloyl-ACP methyl ester carboxylesterase